MKELIVFSLNFSGAVRSKLRGVFFAVLTLIAIGGLTACDDSKLPDFAATTEDRVSPSYLKWIEGRHYEHWANGAYNGDLELASIDKNERGHTVYTFRVKPSDRHHLDPAYVFKLTDTNSFASVFTGKAALGCSPRCSTERASEPLLAPFYVAISR